MQAQTIMDAIAQGSPMPTLLMGDLNEWRPRVPASLVPLEPFFGPLGVGQPSFPSRLPFLALDRILAHPRDMLEGWRRMIRPSPALPPITCRCARA